MKIIKPYTEIITPIDGDAILRHIELCGRVCYKSEDRITEDSARQFVTNIIKRGHESVLEHYSFTVRFVCDRGVSHELVRHRIASFSQESTRYCDYGGAGCTFIFPCWFGRDAQILLQREWHWTSPVTTVYELSIPEHRWFEMCLDAERTYKRMTISEGWSPQQARSVLPNSLKTEVIMTANLREWRHFFKLRTAAAAHPQMRELTVPLLERLKGLIPVVFDDIQGDTD